MSFLLPEPSGGYLEYYLIYAGASALIHTAVCYTASPTVSMKVFSGPAAPSPPPALLPRVYGTKNVYTALIRLCAAYSLYKGIHEVYDLAMATWIGVLWLYSLEFGWFKTVRLQEALWPFVTAGLGLVWMVKERDFYLKL